MHRCHANSTISCSVAMSTQNLHRVRAKKMNVNPKSHRIEINVSDKKKTIFTFWAACFITWKLPEVIMTIFHSNLKKKSIVLISEFETWCWTMTCHPFYLVEMIYSFPLFIFLLFSGNIIIYLKSKNL